jgi:hypothetical protein
MASQQSNLYLFFSNYCPHSKTILTSLNSSSIANSITYCCVDNKQLKIPPFIKSVPTLFIANQQRVLVDQGLKMWLDTELRSGQQQQPQQQQQQPQQRGPPPVDNPANAMNGIAGNALLTGDNAISAYHSNEIGAGFSDAYSFIENPTSSLSHSFTFLDGGNGGGNMPVGPGGSVPSMSPSGGGGKQSEKEQMMNSAYEQLLEMRKMDMPTPIGAMRM